MTTFSQLIADAQALPTRRERATFIQAHADDDAQDKLATLQAFGASGELFDHNAQADGLLDALDARRDVKVYGSGTLRAFNLMVDLGLWEKHENLLLHRHHIPSVFPPDVRHAAEALTPWSPEPWRRDLTRTPCVTIDDASARDLDDALSCVPRIDGGWSFGVHIADPSALVSIDSPLDLSARARGTSLYLPTGTLPMFPCALSEHAMSLVAGEQRPAMTTMIQIDADLNIVDVEVFPSIIKVDHRMSYDQVDQLLDQDPRRPIDVALHDLAYLTDELFHIRREQGAVSFDLPEAKLTVTFPAPAPQADDEEVKPEVRVELLHVDSPSRMLVGEAMVLASTHMARLCHEHDIPVMYRAQEPPDEELFDYDVMAMPEGVPRFFAMRRKMKSGSITTHPEPHFGLGLEMYVQATSPIRRYTDLICQRQVKAFVLGEPLPYSEDEIVAIAADVEHATREAVRASRGTHQYWMYHHLEQTRGEVFAATVLNHRDNRTAFVFIDKLALRVKCTTQRRHAPGDVIQVYVDRVNARREMVRVKER